MTTVINFNVLNFFRLKLNNHTVNDVRISNNLSRRGKDESLVNERVIDVTPYSKVYNGGGTLMLKDVQPPDKKVDHPRLIMGAAVENTYDRQGNSIQIYDSKGIHIDSYV
ncbi:MAG: hypothetical protein AB1499_14505 [Nitrospirota bacterium]